MTAGVVRVGDTVRRPAKGNSPLVRSLLTTLKQRGFDAAPRYLGSDEQGRDVFSFLAGDVPSELDAHMPDDTLAAAAHLIRRYHDATAGSPLAGDAEVVCHNDLSPCNFVFRSDLPVALIDFDAAAPGSRLDDLGYALFLWLNLGTDGPDADEQARRIKIFTGAYRLAPDAPVVTAIIEAVGTTVARLRREGRFTDVEWWQAQLEWVERQRTVLSG